MSVIDLGKTDLLKQLSYIYEVFTDSLPLHPHEVLISEISVVVGFFFQQMFVPVTREIMDWVIVSNVPGSPVAPNS